MSNPHSSSKQEKIVQYVVRALQKNPVEEGASIVNSRNRLLGLAAPVLNTKEIKTSRDPRLQRQEALKQLDAIRSDFWTKPLPDLKASLQAVDAEHFPDVLSVVRRLTVVANHRDKLPQLTAHKSFDGDFLKVFREVLTATPRDSAVAKERMLAQFGKSKVRKRGSKMIRLIQQQLPELYALELNWLNSLVKQKNRKNRPVTLKSRDQFTSTASSGFHIPWWVIVLGLAILRAVIRMSND